MSIDKNILANDSSPYLQQHKDNPVNWQVWSKDILQTAKKNKKPILLSVGYASCHWCHVMAHESFEDKETADLMNKYFINIKVDREERPDLDFVFQSSFQLFNQTGGGWPLTMFLDENGVPFMGGTYFPKNSQNGLPSFKEVLQKVHDAYKEQKENIIKQRELIIKNLDLKKNSVLNQDLEPILETSLSYLDTIKGGYKGSPKFPTFNLYETLLYFYNKTKDKKYLDPVSLLIKQLCSKGIYDHVEGGISRYAVDDDWVIPHFEKMLYDNTQFILLLSKYCKINNDEYYKEKLSQTIEFIKKEFLNKNKLLGSAYDADSDGEEGKYYVFSYNELQNINGIGDYFEINSKGNWEGKIILKEISAPTPEILTQLKKLRKNKIKPFFDSKNQLDLNALWVSALVFAHKVLPDNGYLNQAESFFDKLEKFFLKDEIFHSNSKKMVFIEDYAYTINMLLDLYDQTLKPAYLIKAKNICSNAIKHFYINEKSIFQKNKLSDNDLFHRPLDITDHTVPNGNSIMLLNFSRLGMKKEGKELSDSLNGYLNVYKTLMTSSLKSIDYFNTISSGKKCTEDGCNI